MAFLIRRGHTYLLTILTLSFYLLARMVTSAISQLQEVARVDSKE